MYESWFSPSLKRTHILVGLASLMRATARAAALEPGARVGPNLRRRSCESWVAAERSNAKGDVGTDADAVKEAEEEAETEAEEEADAEADAEAEEEAEEKEDAEAEENHAGKDASRCGNAAGTRSSLRALVGVSIAESVL